MLTISGTQMATLSQRAWLTFEMEMYAHCRVFSPRLCEVLGEQPLWTAVRAAIARATGHGLALRGSIRLFIELSFLCGSAFDTDPQFARLRAALTSDEPEMYRAEKMHQVINHYLEVVAGANNANVREALLYLRALAGGPLEMPSGVIDELKQAFPQKAAWVGDDALQALSQDAVTEARQLGFSTRRQAALLVILKFAFGHGCTDDPLYPWIASTLQDPRIVDSAARAQRLERKALTWLDHVLDGPGRKRAPA